MSLVQQGEGCVCDLNQNIQDVFFDLFFDLRLFIVQAFLQLFLEGFLILFIFKCPRILSIFAKKGIFNFHWFSSITVVHIFLSFCLKNIFIFQSKRFILI